MKAAQVPKPGADFEIVERDIPNPDAGQVRIKVQACGVCHSDVLTKDGFPGINYPRVPGHEVAGVIDELGAGVSAWKKGQRASALDGTAATTARVSSAGRGIFAIAAIGKIRGSATTADISNTWWLRWKHSRQYRRV
jgi:alcohol dehydrogenase/propanol-preferring alcohol dehydrogenase